MLLLLAGCADTGRTSASADQQALATAAGGGCADPWIGTAYRRIFGRAPNGAGNSGECNINQYGGGSWRSYADLRQKVRMSKVCQDPWVGQAVHEASQGLSLAAALPAPGAHSTAGLCNVRLSSWGTWFGYSDLASERGRCSWICATHGSCSPRRAEWPAPPPGKRGHRTRSSSWRPSPRAVVAATGPDVLSHDGDPVQEQAARVVNIDSFGVLALG